MLGGEGRTGSDVKASNADDIGGTADGSGVESTGARVVGNAGAVAVGALDDGDGEGGGAGNESEDGELHVGGLEVVF